MVSVPGKMYCRVLFSRLVERAEDRIEEELGRFRRGRCCVELIVEECREKRKELYVVHIYTENVNEKVCRGKLWY